jgi:radical SAM protein with 4Fe4S-binding SPASM domain
MEKDSLRVYLHDIHLRLTNKCNFDCIHCYAIDSRELIIELDLESVIRSLNKLKKSNCYSITLTGGEPLLYSKFDELYHYLIFETDFMVKIETNGYFLDRFITKFRNDHSRLKLKVSFDHDNIRGEINNRVVYSNLNHLSGGGISFSTQTVIIDTISDCYTEHLKKLKSLNMEEAIFFLNYDRIGNGKNLHPMHFRKALQIKENIESFDPRFKVLFPGVFERCISNYCGWGYTRCEVMSNGDITSCGPINFYNKDFIAGNIYKDNILDTFYTSAHFTKIRNLTREDFDYPCNICDEFSSCRGSCRAIGYSCYGNLLAPFPYCKEYFDSQNISFIMVKPDGTENIENIERELINNNISILFIKEIFLSLEQIHLIYENLNIDLLFKVESYLLSGKSIIIGIKGNRIIPSIIGLVGESIVSINRWNEIFQKKSNLRTRYGKGFFNLRTKKYSPIINDEIDNLVIANAIHRPKNPHQIEKFYNEILKINIKDLN